MPKILIIEDSVVVSGMYKKAFITSGYQASVAADGQTGIEQADTFQPDVILLDIRMPVIDGLEVLKRLKADTGTANIPVVILTNLAGSPEVQAALSLEAVQAVVKSETKPGEIENLVRNILNDKTSNKH